MSFELDEVFHLYQMPTGRLLYAARSVRQALTEDERPLIGPALDALMAAATEARQLEMRHREVTNRPQYGPRAVALDATVDRLVSALVSAIKNARRAFGDDHPLGTAAARLEVTLFPRGAAAVTGLSYVEEVETISDLVTRLSPNGELADDAATLHLAPYVQALATANDALRTALVARPQGATWDQVRAARAHAHGLLLELLAHILGRYPSHSPEDTIRRARLLDPIWRQQEAIARARRRRGPAVDVDPTSGAEVPPDAPLTEPEEHHPEEPTA